MSLKKNNLPLSLNQGINTKIDEKQLPFGQFSHIENVKFDKEGEYNTKAVTLEQIETVKGFCEENNLKLIHIFISWKFS